VLLSRSDASSRPPAQGVSPSRPGKKHQADQGDPVPRSLLDRSQPLRAGDRPVGVALDVDPIRLWILDPEGGWPGQPGSRHGEDSAKRGVVREVDRDCRPRQLLYRALATGERLDEVEATS